MPSLDAKLRNTLYDHLRQWPTGAKTVVTYQVASFRLEHMPVLDVEVGGWTQAEVGNSLRGQRVYERTYTVNVSIVDNTMAADFADSVNAIADQVVRAASPFDAIPFDLQDLTVGSGEYHPVDCATEEGRGGAPTLVCSATVLVNVAKPDVPMGRRHEAPSQFRHRRSEEAAMFRISDSNSATRSGDPPLGSGPPRQAVVGDPARGLH